MMTEAEAKNKRCCSPGTGEPMWVPHPCNRGEVVVVWLCVASRCHAWRWCPERHSGRTADGTVILTHGYCGLGGKP